MYRWEGGKEWGEGGSKRISSHTHSLLRSTAPSLPLEDDILSAVCYVHSPLPPTPTFTHSFIPLDSCFVQCASMCLSSVYVCEYGGEGGKFDKPIYTKHVYSSVMIMKFHGWSWWSSYLQAGALQRSALNLHCLMPSV